ATAGVRRHSHVSRGPTLARPSPLLRILPRGQRSGHRREPPDWLDRTGWLTPLVLRVTGREACPGRREDGDLQDPRADSVIRRGGHARGRRPNPFTCPGKAKVFRGRVLTECGDNP